MKYLLLALFVSFSVKAQTYVLTQSKMTYRGTHTLKTFEGTSTQGKGKGQCGEESCEFLVAVPVKSFDSGNSNRDLHMLETMKGAAHPMIVARLEFPKSELTKKELMLNVEMEIAGVKKKISLNGIQKSESGNGFSVDLTVPFKLSDFGLERPSLLTLKMDDLVPVKIQAQWAKE